MNDHEFERWILRPQPRENAALRLVCFPYAGGSPAAFHGWGELLPPAVEVWLVRLPGRERRLREPPATDLAPLADELAAMLAPRLGGTFALFGHSLGASIAYEVAARLTEVDGTPPVHLAISARLPPGERPDLPDMHELDDERFLEMMDRRFDAIPPAIREDDDLRALYLPILRADARMLETYVPRSGPPLGCSVSAYGGSEDPEVSAEQLDRWRAVTTGGFVRHQFPGQHFFINDERTRVVRTLGDELLGALVP